MIAKMVCMSVDKSSFNKTSRQSNKDNRRNKVKPDQCFPKAINEMKTLSAMKRQMKKERRNQCEVFVALYEEKGRGKQNEEKERERETKIERNKTQSISTVRAHSEDTK